MRRTVTLTLLALAVACHEGADAPLEPTPTPTPGNDLRILGGAVECDGCSRLEFSLGGPDLQWVVGASFVGSDDPRVAPRTEIELRRFTGDSGVVLQARAKFLERLPVGDYDLRLLTPGRASAESMTLERALRVTRVAPPTDSSQTSPPLPTPTPPPGPTTPPPSGPPTPPPPSGVRVSVTVFGSDRDSVFVALSSGCYDYYNYYRACYGGPVSTVRSELLTFPAGTDTVTLDDVARNCSVTSPNPATVTVVADSTVDLSFTVSCVTLGVVEVSVPVSGSDMQLDFTVICTVGDCGYNLVRAPGPVRLDLAPGAYLFALPPETLQSNCQVSGPSTLAVQVTSGATAQISFPVTCLPFGEIRVTVNAPTPGHVYRFQYPAGCGYLDDSCVSLGVVPGFPASIRVPAGAYGLELLDVPANCRVTSANPASVTVAWGAVTDLVFDIACP